MQVIVLVREQVLNTDRDPKIYSWDSAKLSVLLMDNIEAKLKY